MVDFSHSIADDTQTKQKQMRFEFISNGTLCVFRLGTTTNEKIAPSDEVIVQTYHYSRDQYLEAEGKTSMDKFFSADKDVCMDCPYAMSNGAKLKGCYTHKPIQYSGMISQLRSIHKKYGAWENIPVLDKDLRVKVVSMCEGRFVRFGTYGEPILIPLDLVAHVCFVARSWTGYTHQWMGVSNYGYHKYFMASTDSTESTHTATMMGWRAFLDEQNHEHQVSLVNCPASQEQGYKSTCSKCGLCSGTEGKGKKSVYIFNHS